VVHPRWGVQGGETLAAAAVRELAEETGLVRAEADIGPRSVITGHHWWTPSELREAPEMMLPLGLPGLVASLLSEGTPGQPLRLPWRA